jgi:hypothetical protein
VSVVLAATVAVAGGGLANAQPTPLAPGVTTIHYQSKLVDHTVVTSVDAGTFVIAKDRRYVSLHDTAGRTVVMMPLTYQMSGHRHTAAGEVSADGRTLRMTPDDTSKPVPKPAVAAKPIASTGENSAAANDFLSTLGMGTTAGSLLGLAAGALAGVVVGVLGAGAACAALTVLCIVTALPIVASVATVGGIFGTVLVGGPALVYAAYNYAQTVVAPPYTTKYWTHK